MGRGNEVPEFQPIKRSIGSIWPITCTCCSSLVLEKSDLIMWSASGTDYDLEDSWAVGGRVALLAA